MVTDIIFFKLIIFFYLIRSLFDAAYQIVIASIVQLTICRAFSFKLHILARLGHDKFTIGEQTQLRTETYLRFNM